jgi:hypothetical protein
MLTTFLLAISCLCIIPIPDGRTSLRRLLEKLIVIPLTNSQLFIEPECSRSLPLISSIVTSLFKHEKSVRPINWHTGYLFVHDLVRKVLTSGSLVYTMTFLTPASNICMQKESVVTYFNVIKDINQFFGPRLTK